MNVRVLTAKTRASPASGKRHLVEGCRAGDGFAAVCRGNPRDRPRSRRCPAADPGGRRLLRSTVGPRCRRDLRRRSRVRATGTKNKTDVLALKASTVSSPGGGRGRWRTDMRRPGLSRQRKPPFAGGSDRCPIPRHDAGPAAFRSARDHHNAGFRNRSQFCERSRHCASHPALNTGGPASRTMESVCCRP
jgi:hypothetical protein